MACDLLARAATGDPLNANALIVLIGAAVAAGCVLLAAVPVTVVRRRRRPVEGIAAVAVLWALGTAAVVVWSVDRSWAAADERQRQLLGGDADPVPVGTPLPWTLAAGLAAGYAGLIGWSVTGRVRAG